MRRDSAAAPLEMLLRTTCLGCHAQNTGSNIDPLTGAPQVLHTGTDLAAGNFRYLSTSAANGHNVIDLGYNENVLTGDAPPGFTGNHMSLWNYPFLTNFTCAGARGCHGSRIPKLSGGKSGIIALKGAHHGNVDGKCDVATENYNSYRFLKGVKGFEKTGWQNIDANNHNEYFGATTPLSESCDVCHPNSSVIAPIMPKNNTISGFCASCHGKFYWLGSVSPFMRHPTDVALNVPGNNEYAAYTTYSIVAPIARTTVPDFSSPIVNPGADVMMCLSCHAAHASPYFKMMRWDYKGWPGNGQPNGCNVCHTSKN